MSDKLDYLGTENDRSLRLKADVLLLMMKGAGYALVFCLGLIAIVVVTLFIGKLLPDEAREAADPSPWSYNLHVMDDAPTRA